MRAGTMRTRTALAALITAAIGFALLQGLDEEPGHDAARPATSASGPGPGPMVAAPPPQAAETTRPIVAPTTEEAGPEQPPSRVEEDEAAFWRDADIEDFKKEIYARQIESIDRIHLLDDLVHTEVEDTRELWETDWSGVDDWKDTQNGFRLERAGDGTLLFVPGEETQRLLTFFESINVYDYDEANDAFVNEVDYYGKPIFNVVKFLREDVLVMMTISGRKVDLSIYEKGQP